MVNDVVDSMLKSVSKTMSSLLHNDVIRCVLLNAMEGLMLKIQTYELINE